MLYCHIEWVLLFTAPWTVSPDGRVPITAALTVRAPLCARACVCTCVCVYRATCEHANIRRRFRLQGRLRVCAGSWLCVYEVRASPRHRCDIPLKASSERLPTKESAAQGSGGLAGPRSLGLTHIALRRSCWLHSMKHIQHPHSRMVGPAHECHYIVMESSY